MRAQFNLIGELFMAIEAKLHGTRTNRSLSLFTHAAVYYYRARVRKALSVIKMLTSTEQLSACINLSVPAFSKICKALPAELPIFLE